MRLSSALLNQNVDCEGIKDFYQYYHSRYFGYVKPGVSAIWPCITSQQISPNPGYIAYDYWDPDARAWVAQAIKWEDFIASRCFRFGYPNLGTTQLGPTYVYLTNYPRRESIKGIGLYKTTYSVPQYDFIMGRYIGKEPSLRRILTPGAYFASPEEATFLMDILNKKYWDWDEALRGLENGDKIGYQLNKHVGIYLDDKEEDLLLSFKEITKFARIKPHLGSFRVELLNSYKHLAPIAVASLNPLKQNLIIA